MIIQYISCWSFHLLIVRIKKPSIIEAADDNNIQDIQDIKDEPDVPDTFEELLELLMDSVETSLYAFLLRDELVLIGQADCVIQSLYSTT